MADDLFPEDPKNPPPQDANSNNPPPAGSPPDGPPNSTVQGRGAAFMLPVNAEDETRRSYLHYSMWVIIVRPLPAARDGPEPAHRRILYSMHAPGLQYNK